MKEKLKSFISTFIKQTFRIIKTHLILLSGVVLTVYNLFNFSSGKFEGHSACNPPQGFSSPGLPDCPNTWTYPVSTFYHYSDKTLIWLVIGVTLIVIGLLKLKSNKKV